MVMGDDGFEGHGGKGLHLGGVWDFCSGLGFSLGGIVMIN